ncbi:hypothetical protein [Pseudomonas sp. PB103]|jgi:hypothetical protein|uniref:hypothetical protein n=1 Tax=Pseudomonas sp. PB103 TaxID=2494698 RepID=UPI001C49C8C3|nr:hypothetical protein [Pseudomonas sp. PB103]
MYTSIKQLITLIGSSLLFVGFCATAHAEPAGLWRAPAAIVKSGSNYSVILDRGELKKAIAGSNNNYLFSETGAGVQSLVLIGTSTQLVEFLIKHKDRQIENRISQLPDIYMGITPFVPQTRFSGLFPLGDAVADIVTQLTNFIPGGGAWRDIAGIPGTLTGLKAGIDKLSETQKASGKLLYVKFSYLPEDRMVKLGRNAVSFNQVLNTLQDNYLLKRP